jgi:nicotinamidase-related amidase
VTATFTLRPHDTGLVLVDIQERLCAAMSEREVNRAIRNWAALAEMAGRLRLPVAVSEQYPKGLGRTLPLLREILGKVSPPPRFVDKLDFSCCAVPLFEQFVLGSGRHSWLVAGMETHISVFQTVRAMRERSLNVHVVADAVLSRKKADWRTGTALIGQLGAVLTSTETALFDLIARAEGETFDALSKLVR